MISPLEVGLGVRDLSRMRHFYETALGCQFVSEVAVPADKARQAALSDGGYTVVRLQTSYGERIKLLAPANPPAAAVRSGPILDQPNACYLTFIVDDIDAAIARLQAHGVEFLTGPARVEVRPGTFLSFCRDPEGNVLELVQYADIHAYRPDLKNGSV
ncbi:VOC family protein [Alicycliphilus denitrificans]|uniref:VOC family protein n=1 Tax=Alicycliphilus denitrificans TaxID=179636 RepID=A0A420K981_9BURK|nr:VOC family protein [Alicycliphilus denitrificans]RKJ95217.1 VOC family protein [Alicycliphilus denitrificans]